MKGRLYTADDLAEWQSWFDALPEVGPYHSPEYLDLLTGDFEYPSESAELFVYGDEDAFVYYPYIRRSILDIPFAEDALDNPGQYSDVVSSWYWGGPLTSARADRSIAADFLDAFADHCEEAGIVAEFVRFDPNLKNHRDFPALDPRFERETVRVDLGKSTDQLWDEFERRNRNAIRQARDTDLEVERAAGEDDWRSFYEIYTNAMEAKDASAHYRFPFRFFRDLLEREHLASLLIARYGDDVVGGSLLVHDDHIAHDYLRASNPDYWDMRVNNLLCYEALLAMRDAGRRWFDFQGGRPGVFRFKKGFSTVGRGESYLATRTHLDKVYDRLTKAAAAHGIEVDTDYFPAYRKELSV